MAGDDSGAADRDAAIADAPNSDPTGGGPPPAGAVTRVTSDGHGVTQGAIPKRAGQDSDPEPPDREG